MEFVSPAYGDSLHSLIEEVVKIQDCLGDLQDTVFTRALIDRLLKRWKGNVLDPRLLFMLGELYELQGEIARTKQTEFHQIWKHFDQDALRKTLASALAAKDYFETWRTEHQEASAAMFFYNADSMLPTIVRRTLIRASYLLFAPTRVQGAISVEVRSIISHTAW